MSNDRVCRSLESHKRMWKCERFLAEDFDDESNCYIIVNDLFYFLFIYFLISSYRSNVVFMEQYSRYSLCTFGFSWNETSANGHLQTTDVLSGTGKCSLIFSRKISKYKILWVTDTLTTFKFLILIIFILN